MYSREMQGWVVATVGVFILSFDTILIKLINLEIFQIAMMRNLFVYFGGVILFFVYYRQLALFPRQKWLLIVSMCYGFSFIFFVLAVRNTTVANTLILVATTPIWALVGSKILLRHSISSCSVVSVVAAVTGTFFIAYPKLFFSDTTELLGEISALMTAVCMALAFISSKKCGQTKFLALTPSYGGLLAGVALFLFIPLPDINSNNELLIGVVEGAIVLPIGLGAVAFASQTLSPVQLGLILMVESILGPIWAWVFLSEHLSEFLFIGGALIFVALLVHFRSLYHLDQQSSA